MTRAEFLAMAVQVGLSVKETELMAPGRVFDLAKLYMKRNESGRKKGD